MPAGCEAGPSWSAAPYPAPGWAGTRYFTAYDTLGHDLAGAAGDQVKSDVATFLMSKL